MELYDIFIMVEDGRALFRKSFTQNVIPTNLITGMLTGIQQFVHEVSGAFPTELIAGRYTFNFEKIGPLTIVLTTKTERKNVEYLSIIGSRFLSKFGAKIDKWKGFTNEFASFEDDLAEIFGPDIIKNRIDPKLTMNAITILQLEDKLIDVAITMISLKEATSEEVAFQLKKDQKNVEELLDEMVENGYLGCYINENPKRYYV